MKFIKKHYSYLFIIIFSFFIFHFIYGIQIIDPTNINWLMTAYHDWGTHYLGWAFYRNDPWAFPLGEIQSYNYPICSNVGFTDSIPLLALLFKPFTKILPEDFQYFGIWLLSCHILTGYYSYKIFHFFNLNKIIALLGTLLIIANPVLIFRGLHPALCAQWLIIASIYYYLLPSTNLNSKNLNIKQIILLILSSLINPYLTVMILGFNIILPIKNYIYDKSITLKDLIIFILLSFISILSIWYLVGLIDFSNKTEIDVVNSYGMYGFNLNSFFNSFGFSSKIPALETTSGAQYEGFAYFGLGLLLLILISIFIFIYFLVTKRQIFQKKLFLTPLLLFILGLTFFSITNSISYGNEVLFKYPIPVVVEKLGTIFRASGRFIWPLYYLILFSSFHFLNKLKLNKYLAIGLLVILSIVQFKDINIFFNYRNFVYGPYKTPLKEEVWKNLFLKFDAIITYKPFSNNMVYPMDYQDLSFLAMKSLKPISTAYVARENTTKKNQFIDSISNQILNGKLEKNYLFVTTLNEINSFKFLLKNKNFIIKKLDGYFLVFNNKQVNKKIYFDESPKSIKQLDSLNQAFNSRKDFFRLNKEIDFSNKIKFYIEGISSKEDFLKLNGWMFIESSNNNKGDSLYAVLVSDKAKYIIPSKTILRGDITSTYKKRYLDDSGLEIILNTSEMEKGSYQLGLAIKDNKSGIYFFSKTEHFVNIGLKEYKVPKKEVLKINEAPIISNLEHFLDNKKYINISGWAAIQNRSSENSIIKFVLINKNSETLIFETDLVLRNDVTLSNKNQFNYDYSGFQLKIKKSDVPTGVYETAIVISQTNNQEKFIKKFDKKIKI